MQLMIRNNTAAPIYQQIYQQIKRTDYQWNIRRRHDVAIYSQSGERTAD